MCEFALVAAGNFYFVFFFLWEYIYLRYEVSQDQKQSTAFPCFHSNIPSLAFMQEEIKITGVTVFVNPYSEPDEEEEKEAAENEKKAEDEENVCFF